MKKPATGSHNKENAAACIVQAAAFGLYSIRSGSFPNPPGKARRRPQWVRKKVRAKRMAMIQVAMLSSLILPEKTLMMTQEIRPKAMP